MNSNVDERVVQMTFDNKNFEKHAKESMNTLDKLQEKLMFKDSDKESSKALNSIVDNVEKMADKAYTIVDRMVDKMKDNISTKLLDFINTATIGQITSGWNKFADKTRSVGTLISQGYGLEDVNEQLDKLNTFTDETSYNFTEMVSNIAKFTATGQNLEDSVEAMMGIANWAALSGQNAQTASSAMYQLSQAMGSGVMRKEDWKSIQNANMDTDEFRQKALDAAVALGTLQKNADGTYKSLVAMSNKGAEAFTKSQFADSLTQGAWFTKDVMMEVYSTYSSAFDKINDIVEASEDESYTFSKAVEDITESNKALIKSYAETYTQGDERLAEEELDKWEKTAEITEDLVQNFAKVKGVTDQEARMALEHYSGYVSEFGIKAFKAAQEARSLEDAVDSLKDAMSTQFMNIYQDIFGDYSEAKALWTDLANGLYEIFVPRINAIHEALADWHEAGGRTTLFQGIYAFAHAIQLTSEGVNLITSKIFTGDKVATFTRISEAIQHAGFEFYYFMRELSNSPFFENIGDALNNIVNPIKVIINLTKQVIAELFPKVRTFKDFLVDISKRFVDFSQMFVVTEETSRKLKSTIKGILSAIHLVKKTLVTIIDKIVLPMVSIVVKVGGKILSVILDITAALGEIITAIDQVLDLSKMAEFISTGLVKVIDWVGSTLKTAAAVIIKVVVPAIGWLINRIKDIKDIIVDLFSGSSVKSEATKRFSKFGETVSDAWNSVGSFKDVIDRFKGGKGLFNFLEMIGAMFDHAIKRIGLTIEALRGLGEEIDGGFLGGLLSAMGKLYDGVKWIYTNLLKPILIATYESVKGVSSSIVDSLKKGDVIGAFEKLNKILTTGVLYRLYTVLHGIRGILGGNGILGLVTQINGIAKSIRKYFNAQAMEANAAALRSLVVSVGLMFGIITLVAMLPDGITDKFLGLIGEFALAMTVMVGGLIGVAFAAKLAQFTVIGILGVVISIGVMMIEIITAIRMSMNLINQDKDTFYEGLHVLETIIGLIAGLVAAIGTIGLIGGKRSGESVMALGVVLLGIGAMLLGFSVAINALSAIDFETAAQNVVLIMGLFGMIAVAMRFIGDKSISSKSAGIGTAIAMLSMAATVAYILVPIIKSLAKDENINWDGAWQSLVYFAGTMLAISGAIALMNGCSKGSLQIIAAGIVFNWFTKMIQNQLVPFIDTIKKYDWSEATDNLVVLGIVVGGIAAAIAAIGFGISLIFKAMKDIKFGQMVVIGASLAAIIYTFGKIIIPAIANLSSENWHGFGIYLATIAVSLIGMLLTFEALANIASDKKLDNKLILAEFLSIALTLAVIGGVLIPAIKGMGDLTTGDWIGYAIGVLGSIAAIVYAVYTLSNDSAKVDFKKTVASFAGIVAVLIAVRTCLVAGINALKDTDISGFIAYTGGAIIAISTISYAVYQLSKNSSDTDFGKMIVSFGGLTAVLIAMRTCLVSGLNALKGTDIDQIVVLAGTMAVALGGIYMFIKELSMRTDVKLEKMITSFLGLTAVLGVLGGMVLPALSTLVNTDWKSIIAACAGVSALMIAMGYTMRIVNDSTSSIFGKKTKGGEDFWISLGKQATSIVSVFALLGSLALTLPFICAAFQKVADIPSDTLFIAAISIGGLIAALMLVSKFVAAGGAVNLLAVSVAILAIAAAIWLVADAITSLINAINGRKDPVQSMISGMQSGAPKLVAATENMTNAVNDTVQKTAKINSPSKVMMQNGKYIVAGLTKGITKNTKSVIKPSANMANKVNDTVQDELEIHSPSKVMYENGRYVVIGLANGMSSYESKRALKGSSQSTADILANALGTAVSDSMKDVKIDTNFDIWGDKKLDDLVDDFIGSGAGEKVTSFLTEGDNSLLGKVTNVFTGENGILTKAKEWGSGLLSNFETGIKDGSILASILRFVGIDKDGWIGQIVNGTGNGEEAITAELSRVAKNVADSVMGDNTILGKFEALGKTLGENLAQGAGEAIMDNLPVVLGPFNWTTTGELKSGGSPKTQQEKDAAIGRWGDYGFTASDNQLKYTSKSGHKYDLKTDAKTLSNINKMFNYYEDHYDDYVSKFASDFQTWIDKGFLRVGTSGFLEFWEEAPASIKQLWEKEFGINSPSKWAEWIGEMVNKGLANGLDFYATASEKAAENVISGVSDEMELGLKGLETLATTDRTITPRIVPVFDFTGIQNGVSGVKTFMSDQVAKVASVASTIKTGDTGTDGLVSSLDKMMAGVKNSIVEAVLASASQTDVNVNVTADTEGIFKSVISENKKFKQRTGRTALG